MRIAFQGEHGSYSEEACLELFPEAVHEPTVSIRRVFEAVEVGRVERGLVPLENSQAGSINETYDLFLRHGLHLVAETVVPVDHCLLGVPGAALDEIREVISHPQALAQCEEFVGSLGASPRAEYDTAGAAKRIAAERLTTTTDAGTATLSSWPKAPGHAYLILIAGDGNGLVGQTDARGVPIRRNDILVVVGTRAFDATRSFATACSAA